jgi:hypothetical protein
MPPLRRTHKRCVTLPRLLLLLLGEPRCLSVTLQQLSKARRQRRANEQRCRYVPCQRQQLAVLLPLLCLLSHRFSALSSSTAAATGCKRGGSVSWGRCCLDQGCEQRCHRVSVTDRQNLSQQACIDRHWHHHGMAPWHLASSHEAVSLRSSLSMLLPQLLQLARGSARRGALRQAAGARGRRRRR